MKVVFTLLIICSFEYLKGQDYNFKIGKKNFQTFSICDNIIIYLSSCENNCDYQFASRSVIRYDSIMHIGYLGIYKYTDGFTCQNSTDTSVVEEIKTLLLKESKTHNKIGILFTMEDENKEFIGALFLFKKKNFKKFSKRANKVFTRNYSGEKILMQEYDYYKYSKEFILAKIGNVISLIPVSYASSD